MFFINEFNKLIFTNIRSYKRIIITGDFNINMLTKYVLILIMCYFLIILYRT